jgi:hypothetical protein
MRATAGESGGIPPPPWSNCNYREGPAQGDRGIVPNRSAGPWRVGCCSGSVGSGHTFTDAFGPGGPLAARAVARRILAQHTFSSPPGRAASRSGHGPGYGRSRGETRRQRRRCLSFMRLLCDSSMPGICKARTGASASGVLKQPTRGLRRLVARAVSQYCNAQYALLRRSRACRVRRLEKEGEP